MQNRLEFLDSTRGLAALFVLFGHFFPGGALREFPFLNFVLDTKLAVALFFVLSGYVLFNRLFLGEQGYSVRLLSLAIMGRFIRLFIPVFCVTILVLLLLSNQPQFRLEAYSYWFDFSVYYEFERSIFDVIYYPAVEVFFLYDKNSSYIPPAWTMRPELFGSIFVILLLYLERFVKVAPGPLLLGAAVLISLYQIVPFVYYFAFFALGVALRKLNNERSLHVGFLIGAITLKTSLEYFGIDSFHLDFVFAGAILYFILRSKSAQILLSKKVFVYLGKISFVLYLVHVPIIALVSPYLFLAASSLSESYYVVVAIVFLAVLGITLLVSSLFNVVEDFAINMNKIIRRI